MGLAAYRLGAPQYVRLLVPFRQRAVRSRFAEQEGFAEIKGEFKSGLLCQQPRQFLYRMKLHVVHHDVAASAEHVVRIKEIHKGRWPSMAAVNEREVHPGRGIDRLGERWQHPLGEPHTTVENGGRDALDLAV